MTDAWTGNDENISQSGFSLFEVVLSVGLGAILLVGAYKIIGGWGTYALDRTAAAQMMRVQEAAEAYVSANFMSLWTNRIGEAPGDTNADGVLNNADLGRIGQHFILPVNDDGAVPAANYLTDDTGTLQPGYSDILPNRQRVIAMVRNLGFVGGKRTLEVMTLAYADNDGAMLDETKALDVASAIGTQGGVLLQSEAGAICAGNIRSAYGTWSVPVPALNVTAGETYCPLITPTPDGKGYPAVYGQVSHQEDINSAYLYRIPVADRPDLNHMQANLDMNNFSIFATDLLYVDNMRVAGRFAFGRARYGIPGMNPPNSSAFSLIVDEVMQLGGENNALNGGFNPDNPADRLPDGTSYCELVDYRAYDKEIDGSLEGPAKGPCTPRNGILIVKGSGLPPGEPAVHVQTFDAGESLVSAANIIVNGDMDSGPYVDVGTLTIRAGDDLVSLTADTLNATGTINSTQLRATTLGGPAMNMTAGTVTSALNVSGSLNAANLSADTLTVPGIAGVGGTADLQSVNVGILSSCTAIVRRDGPGFITVPAYNCMP